jgi:hypothetical protein
MNVEIGTEAMPFPEKEYINWIFNAVCPESVSSTHCKSGRPSIDYKNPYWTNITIPRK